MKRNLTDLSGNFKVCTVSKEAVVKNFVEEKTHRSYIKGQAYYQLMKDEKVQSYKQVLIMEKGKGTIWGGNEARDLIGLPYNADAKVSPGNHAGFDLFIQSSSVNRKLSRGTKLLIEISK